MLMKRNILFFFLISSFIGSSQDLTSNKGENILPQSGDWSMGISVHPIIHLFSDVMVGDQPNVTIPSFGDDLYFHMKRFLTDKKAVRYTVGANFDTNLETWSIGVGYGVENRKGTTRLQGMWGYNGFIGIGEKFDSSDWLSIPTIIYEDGYNMHVMSGVFIGCEYFFMPKIAIGAEYHYGATMHVTDNKTYFKIGNNTNNTVVKINFYF